MLGCPGMACLLAAESSDQQGTTGSITNTTGPASGSKMRGLQACCAAKSHLQAMYTPRTGPLLAPQFCPPLSPPWAVPRAETDCSKPASNWRPVGAASGSNAGHRVHQQSGFTVKHNRTDTEPHTNQLMAISICSFQRNRVWACRGVYAVGHHTITTATPTPAQVHTWIDVP